LRWAGGFVTDFRELETPIMVRNKDVVLMATVSSFEQMPQPGRHELRQFAELFEPVFKASSIEARRNSIAALSRCPTMPQAVMWFISTQPIELAAIFLTSSPAIDDDMLIAVARSQGPAYARAVAARDNLSVKVVDALVGMRQGVKQGKVRMAPGATVANGPVAGVPVAGVPVTVAPVDAWAADSIAPAAVTVAAGMVSAGATAVTDSHLDAMAAREEEMRQQLKALVHRDTLVRSEESPENAERMQQALLVRFARLRDAQNFATTLADTLGSSRWLSHRILLDISGLQLATALLAAGIDTADGEFILTQFYPHLKELAGELPRAARLWSELDAAECGDRLRIWIRADDYTQGKMPDAHAANANRSLPDAAITTLAAPRQAFGRRRGR